MEVFVTPYILVVKIGIIFKHQMGGAKICIFFNCAIMMQYIVTNISILRKEYIIKNILKIHPGLVKKKLPNFMQWEGVELLGMKYTN